MVTPELTDGLLCDCRTEVIDNVLYVHPCRPEHGASWRERLPGMLEELGADGLFVAIEVTCMHRPGVPTRPPAEVHTYCLDCGAVLD